MLTAIHPLSNLPGNIFGIQLQQITFSESTLDDNLCLAGSVLLRCRCCSLVSVFLHIQNPFHYNPLYNSFSKAYQKADSGVRGHILYPMSCQLLTYALESQESAIMYLRDSCAFSSASVFLQISSAHVHARFYAEHDTRSDRGNRKHCTYYLYVSCSSLNFILIRNLHSPADRTLRSHFLLRTSHPIACDGCYRGMNPPRGFVPRALGL